MSLGHRDKLCEKLKREKLNKVYFTQTCKCVSSPAVQLAQEQQGGEPLPSKAARGIPQLFWITESQNSLDWKGS